jgi:hypothetical protein
VIGKTQVAPKVKNTIPRMELVMAVNSMRLAKKVKESLRIPLAGVRYFTDSSACISHHIQLEEESREAKACNY